MESHKMDDPEYEVEMPVDTIKRDPLHLFGNSDSSTRNSNVSAFSQVPGGTSLLVGKNFRRHKLPIRGSMKVKPVDRRKDSNDNEPNPTGRPGPLALRLPSRPMSISGPHSNPNSRFEEANMTYLFHKVVSDSDCKRNGHFALPRYKIEEHFPPINKPQGTWTKLVDNEGKEWSFELCYWINKGKRIYKFKKFYPFVQSANLIAGDTVFFRRLEPRGTLHISIQHRAQESPQMKHVDKVGGILGSKRKRLQVDLDEYSQWMDTQELLQPAPGVVPTVVTIDGHDFEEFKEPPVLIKMPSNTPKKT